MWSRSMSMLISITRSMIRIRQVLIFGNNSIAEYKIFGVLNQFCLCHHINNSWNSFLHFIVGSHSFLTFNTHLLSTNHLFSSVSSVSASLPILLHIPSYFLVYIFLFAMQVSVLWLFSHVLKCEKIVLQRRFWFFETKTELAEPVRNWIN